jgi:hypothetical protein
MQQTRCDSPARRSSTSFNSGRLTAHWRLVAHVVLEVFVQHDGQVAWSSGDQQVVEAFAS